MMIKKQIVYLVILACVLCTCEMADARKKEITNTASTKKLSVEIGKNHKLAYNKNYSYKSNNKKIVSVSKKGVIKAKNAENVL